jgi:hypothetical protein
MLGKKLELEALELEADKRPAGHFNDASAPGSSRKPPKTV